MTVANKKCIETYRPTSTLTFLLIDDKIIVATGLQTFLIKYTHANYIPKLNLLRELIRNNKVKTITDVVDYCTSRNENYKSNDMPSLEMIGTRIERHL